MAPRYASPRLIAAGFTAVIVLSCLASPVSAQPIGNVSAIRSWQRPIGQVPLSDAGRLWDRLLKLLTIDEDSTLPVQRAAAALQLAVVSVTEAERLKAKPPGEDVGGVSAELRALRFAQQAEEAVALVKELAGLIPDPAVNPGYAGVQAGLTALGNAVKVRTANVIGDLNDFPTFRRYTEARLATLAERADTADRSAVQLAGRADTAEASAKELATKVTKLRTEVNRLSELEDDLDEANEQIEDLRSEVKKLSGLGDRVKDAEDEIARLKAEITRLTTPTVVISSYPSVAPSAGRPRCFLRR